MIHVIGAGPANDCNLVNPQQSKGALLEAGILADR